jgi:hypothetical protein
MPVSTDDLKILIQKAGLSIDDFNKKIVPQFFSCDSSCAPSCEPSCKTGKSDGMITKPTTHDLKILPKVLELMKLNAKIK